MDDLEVVVAKAVNRPDKPPSARELTQRLAVLEEALKRPNRMTAVRLLILCC